MYSIKLMHGHAMTFGKDIAMIDTAYCQLLWTDEETGKVEVAGTTRGYKWTKKTAKRADEWARREGRDLMGDRDAYLRKHGERLEVVKDRERKAKAAEDNRQHMIGVRCKQKRWEIIQLLKPVSPALAHYLETGQDLTVNL